MSPAENLAVIVIAGVIVFIIIFSDGSNGRGKR